MIRMPRANMQDLKYSNFQEKQSIEKKDADGNVIYVKVNGKKHPVMEELPAQYTSPIDFRASISMSGNKDTEAVEFGIDVSSYSAVITTPKGMLNITESSIVWFQSEPKFKKDGTVDDSSADYKVVRISSSLLYDRIVLAKKVNN